MAAKASQGPIRKRDLTTTFALCQESWAHEMISLQRENPGGAVSARPRQIDAESKIGAQLGRRQHPAERSGAGFFRGGVVVPVGEVASGVSGRLLEGDFHPGQAFQFGDELAFAPERG
jgi:hypothetical protein